ncbi:MAG: osmotically-inducible protein OsmY [Cellvibrionaceae bacterium]|jgi:osmotically-inducible protein OsmY
MKTLGLLFILLFVNGCTTIVDATTKEPINSDPRTRSFGTYIDDKRLETIATVNIRKADPIFRQSHIRVISFKDVILLVGQVPTNELRLLAGQTANQVNGVRKVYNEIDFAANTSFWRRSQDTWITSKVKTSFLSNQEINGLKIKVVTENGVVYLMGAITEEKSNLAADLASIIGGVKEVVRVFEYIDK